jgi:RloB-like protein
MTRRRLAPPSSMKRPHRPKQRKKRFLLYCEGEVTEPEYFRDLRRFLRNPLVEIEIGDGKRNDPKGLVELAKKRRDAAQRDAKREKDESLLFDEVWCVFDVDDHANLREAIQQAAAASISLAISNPCFELWILIHFKDQWSYISGVQSQSDLRRFIQDYNKRVDFSKIEHKGHSAIARARKMAVRAQEGGDEFDNPTTGMWRLVATLCREANFPVDKI